MDKKSIIFLIIAIIIFIIALAFFIFSNVYTSNNNEVSNLNGNNNVENLGTMENDNLQENTISNEEVSQTKDLDVTYTDFTAYSKDDEEVKLSDYKDQAVMILFWNTENAGSVEMLKRVNEIYFEYREKIKIIAVNTKNEKDAEVLNEVTVPVYFDKDEKIVNTFNISEFPAMIYINNQNEVINAKTGLTTKDALQANFDILTENF